jgi:UDP-2-acetamido-3-amino-2,3-dideoxy-glucuronate N-acetyltransferase
MGEAAISTNSTDRGADGHRLRPAMSIRIHPTAIVEDGVAIGSGTAIWDNVHIRAPASIGRECIVGEKSYIAYGVAIADRVKINAFVYICSAVTIETGVMIAAGTIFTNDRYPRATTPDLAALRGSEPDEHTLPTVVREGATIGARCVIGCDLEIGRFAMVGMGAVVTRSVPDFHLVAGHPARTIGLVCRCGERLRDGSGLQDATPSEVACPACHRRYRVEPSGVHEFPYLVGVVHSANRAAR